MRRQEAHTQDDKQMSVILKLHEERNIVSVVGAVICVPAPVISDHILNIPTNSRHSHAVSVWQAVFTWNP